MTTAGSAKLHLGSYEQAIAWFRRAIEANRNNPPAYLNLAAALAQLGRLDEARSAVRAGPALNPAYTVSRRRASWTAQSDDPTYLAQLEPIFDGMRKVGASGGMKQVEGSLRERVRCSSLVDWPDYPRLKGTMQGSECARNSAARVAAARSFGCWRTGPPPLPSRRRRQSVKPWRAPYRLVVAEAFVGES